jgi:predicted TIM-barrel fold metal-dependent hydrolase
MGDTTILVRKYRNVFADLCMLPLFSSGASRQILHELIEGATADRIMWGCDTWTPEESYGSLLAFRHVLTSVLSEKITEGYFSTKDAACIIDNVLYNNAAILYRFEDQVSPDVRHDV